MRRHAGSFLILALALITVMVILAFTFVATATMWRGTSTSLLRGGLAAEAAQAGVAHALWVIGKDYRERPTEPSSLASAWRSEFDPIGLVYAGTSNAGSPADCGEDNVRIGDFLTNAYVNFQGGNEVYDAPDGPYATTGVIAHHGLARYIEVNRHARDLGQAAVPFSRPLPMATPQIDSPITYDANWLPTTDATRIRYRLRYAVGIEDLSGHLLLPRQAAYNASGPFADKVEYDPGLLSSGYHRSFYNIADIACASGCQARMPTDAAAPNNANRGGFYHWQGIFQGLGTSFDQLFFAGFDAGGGPSFIDYDDGTQLGLTNPATSSALAGSLNRQAEITRRISASNGAPFWRADGGGTTLVASCPGAVYSWAELLAMAQTRVGMPNFGLAANGGTYPNPTAGVAATQEAASGNQANPLLQFVWTPFGKPAGMVGTPARSGIDCPWQVNPLTAPPRVIAAMVAGLLRRELKSIRYDIEQHFAYTGKDADGNDTWAGAAYDTYNIPLAQQETACLDGIDLFTRDLAPGGSTPFADFSPAYNYCTNASGLQLLLDPVNAADWPFPGQEFHCIPSEEGLLPGGLVGKKVQDVLGRQVTASLMDGTMSPSHNPGPISPDAGSSAPMLPAFTNSRAISYYSRKHNAAGDSNDKNLIVWSSSQANPDSYWWDVATALAHSVALTHASWTGSGTLDPAAISLAKIDSVQKMDRVFLGLLGENPGVLGPDPNPQRWWVARANWWSGDKLYRKLTELGPTASIKSLKDANLLDTTDATRNAVRAKQMERLVNDVRMSVFGACPDYAGFQAIDFDGDGKYQSSFTIPAAPLSGTNHASDSTTATPTRWFSLTGYFTIGKSHWFRVWSRGEVFDVVKHVMVDSHDLEVVYTIDPGNAGPGNPDCLKTAHIIYQHRLENRPGVSLSRAAK